MIFKHKFYSAHSNDHGVIGRHCVSVVLIRCLPTVTPYILGQVVDRGRDTPVESFAVHSLNIGQVGSSYEGSHALFLIFLVISLMCRYKGDLSHDY